MKVHQVPHSATCLRGENNVARPRRHVTVGKFQDGDRGQNHMMEYVQWLQTSALSLTIVDGLDHPHNARPAHPCHGLVLSALIMINHRYGMGRKPSPRASARAGSGRGSVAMAVLTVTGIVLTLSAPRRTCLIQLQVKRWP